MTEDKVFCPFCQREMKPNIVDGKKYWLCEDCKGNFRIEQLPWYPIKP